MATHRLYIAGGTSATGPTGHEALCTTNAIAGPATPPVGVNTAINIPHYFAGSIQKIASLDPTDSKKVIAVGDSEIAYWSHDAGATWTQSIGINGSGQNFASLAVSGNNVWIGGDEGQTYYSNNAGLSFSVIQNNFLPTPTGIPTIGMVVLDLITNGPELVAVTYDSIAGETFLYKSTVNYTTTIPTWDKLNGAVALAGKVHQLEIDAAGDYQIIQETAIPANTGIRASYNGGVTFDTVNLNTEITAPRGLLSGVDGGISFSFAYGDGGEIDQMSTIGPPLNYTNKRAYNVANPIVADMIMVDQLEGWVALNAAVGEVHSTVDGGITDDALIYTHSDVINTMVAMTECKIKVRTCGTGCEGYNEYLLTGMPCNAVPGDIYRITTAAPLPAPACPCVEIIGQYFGTADADVLTYEKYEDCATCAIGYTNWLLTDCQGVEADKVIDGTLQDLSVYIGGAIITSSLGANICWQVTPTVLAVTDPPVTIVTVAQSCRGCSTVSVPSRYLLRNCIDQSFTMVVQGAGYILGQVVAIDAFLPGTTYQNCWEVIANTSNPADLLADTISNWDNCDFCNNGYASYEVRVCGQVATSIMSLNMILPIGSIITVGANTYGFSPTDCIEIIAIDISTNPVAPVTGLYADCSECEAGLPSCFTLESCNPLDYPSITEAISLDPVTAPLAVNVGSIMTNINGVANQCYRVLYNSDCSAPTGIADATLLGSDCADFSILSTVTVPPTNVGDCNQFTVSVTNNSANDQSFTFSLSGCVEITLVDPATQVIPAGTSLAWELEYCPTAVVQGICNYNIQGPCNDLTGELCYKSVEVGSCTYYNICITEDGTCIPDCIMPGSVVPIKISGVITSILLFPIQITLIVTNESSGDIVFQEDFVAADNTELDSIIANVPVAVSGKYCAEICVPGCDSVKKLCFDVCDPFDTYKDECNKWHLFKPNNCGPQKYLVSVTELDGDVVSDSVEWDAATNPYYYFDIPHDGIFIITMADYLTGVTIYTFAVFETCQIEKCFKILMDKVMCSCADPCCEKCNGTPEKEVEFARMTLNKLNPLYLTYLGMASKYKVDSIGMQLIPSDTMEFLYSADDVMDKITELLEKCDCLCAEENNTKSNTGRCKNC